LGGGIGAGGGRGVTAGAAVNETVASREAPAVSLTVTRSVWEPATVGVKVGPRGIQIDGLPLARVPETFPERAGQVPGQVCHDHA